MRSRDFCYWIQGYFEILEAGHSKNTLDENQIQCIKNHLNLVFKHEIDPEMGNEEVQEVLNKIHNSGKLTQEPINKIQEEAYNNIQETLVRC